MQLSNLPQVTFVKTGEPDTVLNLGRCESTISALGEYLRATIRDGTRVGLIFRSSPELLLTWLAALLVGFEPLILQYPTRKQSLTNWFGSVENTLNIAGIDALCVSPEIAKEIDARKMVTIDARLIESLPTYRGPVGDIQRGSILQLSSGTTGHRKPIRFTLDQVARHLEDYSRVLLKGEDRIVSWLPLYHDMGFVACWLLPLMSGTPVVMMDPMEWSDNPTLLFDAIKRHGGTLCFLPNFAFEVLARHPGQGPFPTMRSWISCSEPVYEATLRRFMAAAAVPERTVSACYAMAENVFAVTQSEGLQAVKVDGHRSVSCGHPIPGCEIKAVDGQIWVRSRASIESYLDGNRIVDADGFYPTGDLGTITEAGLVVSGRMHDLINVAGRKYLLNDLDLALRAAVPEARGRATTFANRIEHLGTEQPVFLAEDAHFFARDDEATIRSALVQTTGVESLAFHFAPPHFITKTSSGKVNRLSTMRNWLEAERWRRTWRASSFSSRDLAEEVRELFGPVPLDRPIVEAVDSLGLVSLRLAAERHGLQLRRSDTLADLLVRAGGQTRPSVEKGQHLSIVSLAERQMMDGIDAAIVGAWSEALGQQVTLEHVCLPPSPILLQDLIFHDYFLPRARTPHYQAVELILQKIKRASVLIIDDIGELACPFEQVFPQLDHQFRRWESADLLCFRWQQYTSHHHHLPLKPVAGWELPEDRNTHISLLSKYLRIPIFRFATLNRFEEVTDTWELVDRRHASHAHGPLEPPPALADALLTFLKQNEKHLRLAPGAAGSSLRMSDLAHFCSWRLDEARVCEVLDRHHSFLIIGMPSSLPFVTKRLAALGKPFVHVNSTDLSHIDAASYECVLTTGGWGQPETEKPIYQLCTNGRPPVTFEGDHFIADDEKTIRREVYAELHLRRHSKQPRPARFGWSKIDA